MSEVTQRARMEQEFHPEGELKRRDTFVFRAQCCEHILYSLEAETLGSAAPPGWAVGKYLLRTTGWCSPSCQITEDPNADGSSSALLLPLLPLPHGQWCTESWGNPSHFWCFWYTLFLGHLLSTNIKGVCWPSFCRGACDSQQGSKGQASQDYWLWVVVFLTLSCCVPAWVGTWAQVSTGQVSLCVVGPIAIL